MMGYLMKTNMDASTTPIHNSPAFQKLIFISRIKYFEPKQENTRKITITIPLASK